jgi:hypothetical protein
VSAFAFGVIVGALIGMAVLIAFSIGVCFFITREDEL